MDNNENESIKYDCFRGCTVVQDAATGEPEVNYRRGCCKLRTYDYLKGVSLEKYKDIYEVRFKNTRKAFFVNASGQSIKQGDLVVVEASTGHDLGIVTLEGAVVARQLKCKGIDPETAQFRRYTARPETSTSRSGRRR